MSANGLRILKRDKEPVTKAEKKIALKAVLAASDLIEQPLTWCQGAAAKNRHGLPTLPDGPDTCCWCMSGAIYRSAPSRTIRDIIGAVFFALYGHRMHQWNDHQSRSHSGVLNALKRLADAISNLKTA